MKKSFLSKTISIILAFSFVLACSVSTAFCDQDSTPGASFDWSPNVSSTVVKIDPDDATDILITSAFKFSEEAASINNTTWWFTLEHNAREAYNENVHGKASAVWQYSNLPGVHYDVDDDNEDGYYEEAEAIVTTRDISSTTTYVASTEYEKDADWTTGLFLTIAQRSILAVEYQALHYDRLVNYVWDSSNVFLINRNLTYSQSSNNQTVNSVDTAQLLYSQHNSLMSLDDMVTQQQRDYLTLLSNMPLALGDSSIESNYTTATITFSAPISIQALTSLLSQSGANLVSYQAKFTDSNGTWCTLAGNVLDETVLLDKATKFAAENNIVHTQYNGVTSAIVKFDVTSDAYNTLANSPLIYFVDVSEFLWENSENYDPTADVVVPSYAWQLAELK